jgi:hypothetical protein
MDEFDPSKPPSRPAPTGDRTPSTSHVVGYGNVPTIRRFKPDQSGNRKGRPRGSKNRKTIVRRLAREMHRVTENGRIRRRSTLELVLLTLRNLALGGNERAFRYFNEITAKYEPQPTDSKLGYLVVPAPISDKEWIAREEELNKTRKPPPGYKPRSAT